MPTIKYDRKVANFIAGLNATGHVTHTRHCKTSVTFHHNGGRLSLKGILEVWKSRPASAHFQVDGVGAVGQYVNVTEYAWATGTTKGNQQSISIEMANSAVGGQWPVAAATWHNAARLAAWLHWKVIGHRPTANSIKYHKDWKSTACPGGYMGLVRGQLLRLTQWWYDELTGKHKKAPAKPSRPTPKPAARKTNAQIAAEVLAGKWGNGDERRRRLTTAGYNYTAVQNIVNSRRGAGAPSAERKKSVGEIVQEVIDGEWGNGSVRKTRLEGAGYNYSLVQAEVNRRLR